MKCRDRCLRGKQSHVCPTNSWIRDFGVKGGDGNKHDRGHEGAEDVLDDDDQ